MGLSSAMSIASSGLMTLARTAEVVSNNVANAATEGYSRQDVALSPQMTGQYSNGVRIDAITRAENLATTTARRVSQADLGAAQTSADAMAQLADLLGLPGETDALASRLVAFEDALRGASAAPDSTALQGNVLSRANDLSAKLNDISAHTRAVRGAADTSIMQQVQTVNESLKQIETINAQIRMVSHGNDLAELEDARQRLMDRINTIVPIRQLQRDGGDIAIYTKNGAALLDGSARQIEFNPHPIITEDMTLAGGALSGLSIAGRPLSVGTGTGQMDGGTLGATFHTRDTVAVAFGARIDAIAQDVIARFQDPALDASRAPGDPGLFTDAGGAMGAGLGLAGRIGVNAAVDPVQGGAVWRLRDGLGAATPGVSGDAGLFVDMLGAMATQRTPPVGSGLTGAFAAADMAGALSADHQASARRADETAAFRSGQFDQLRTRELALTAVDTDREMQSLMVIEQAYAANARVINTLDILMKTLLDI